MGRVYGRLGLRCAALPEGATDPDKAKLYGCDVIYLTAKQLTFDHLRDQIRLGGAGGLERGRDFQQDPRRRALWLTAAGQETLRRAARNTCCRP